MVNEHILQQRIITAVFNKDFAAFFDGDSGWEEERETAQDDAPGDSPDPDPESVEHSAAAAADDAVGAEEEEAAHGGALAHPGGAGACARA